MLKSPPETVGLSPVLLVSQQDDVETSEALSRLIGRPVVHHDDIRAVPTGSTGHVTDGRSLVIRWNDDPKGMCRNRRLAHTMPPSMLMTCPVTYPACSETRNDTSAATSSAVPTRFIGTSDSTWAEVNACLTAGDSIRPGATTFTVTPREASSSAKDLLAP